MWFSLNHNISSVFTQSCNQSSVNMNSGILVMTAYAVKKCKLCFQRSSRRVEQTSFSPVREEPKENILKGQANKNRRKIYWKAKPITPKHVQQGEWNLIIEMMIIISVRSIGQTILKSPLLFLSLTCSQECNILSNLNVLVIACTSRCLKSGNNMHKTSIHSVNCACFK
jgi:hypothetical protein